MLFLASRQFDPQSRMDSDTASRPFSGACSHVLSLLPPSQSPPSPSPPPLLLSPPLSYHSDFASAPSGALAAHQTRPRTRARRPCAKRAPEARARRLPRATRSRRLLDEPSRFRCSNSPTRPDAGPPIVPGRGSGRAAPAPQKAQARSGPGATRTGRAAGPCPEEAFQRTLACARECA